ncbi:unnamed protein product [Ectocarpus sp. CCAP 1310/34]|nr:unnamed protein product [Ectocarpus sp. CCAP 1310/34]
MERKRSKRERRETTRPVDALRTLTVPLGWLSPPFSTAAASTHAVARSRSRCRFAPCRNAAASDHAAARSHAFTAALCHFAVTVGDPRSWPAVLCLFAVTVGDPRSRPAAAAAAGPRDAPAYGSRHAAASPGYKGRGYDRPAAAKPYEIGHKAQHRTHLDARQEYSGVDAGGSERGGRGRRELGGAEVGEPGGAGTGGQAEALAAADPGAAGAGFPLAFATLLANREDIDATLRDQRPPEQRPDLPHCQASDLRVPKSYKEAMASEHRHFWSDSMQREFYGLLEAGTFTPAKLQLVENAINAWGDSIGRQMSLDGPLRMLAALACELNLDLCHFDVEQAFVRSELEEDVYMRLPQGCGALSGMIVKLGKSLYGLRQASKQRHAMLKRLTISQQTFTDELAAEYAIVGACGGTLMRTLQARQQTSVSGGIVMCGGGAVSWFSRTQKCVTLSTTEAEYVARGDVVKEILFLRQIWRFMLPQVGMPCIPIFEDNQRAIQLAQNPISNSNSKHIDVRHHFLRELVERKEISVIHVPSPYHRADFLTKSLSKDAFESHRAVTGTLWAWSVR